MSEYESAGRAYKPSNHPDAMGNECKEPYSHLRPKRTRKTLLTKADAAVLLARRERKAACEKTAIRNAKRRKTR